MSDGAASLICVFDLTHIVYQVSTAVMMIGSQEYCLGSKQPFKTCKFVHIHCRAV